MFAVFRYSYLQTQIYLFDLKAISKAFKFTEYAYLPMEKCQDWHSC